MRLCAPHACDEMELVAGTLCGVILGGCRFGGDSNDYECCRQLRVCFSVSRAKNRTDRRERMSGWRKRCWVSIGCGVLRSVGGDGYGPAAHIKQIVHGQTPGDRFAGGDLSAFGPEEAVSPVGVRIHW